MAEKDPDPRIKRTLNDRQIAERKNLLTTFSIEKLKLERKADMVRDELKPLTDQIKVLDEQITNVTTEIDEKAAWIPRQMALGEDPAAEPAPGASKPARSKKKATRRGSNGVATSDDQSPPPEAAE